MAQPLLLLPPVVSGGAMEQLVQSLTGGDRFTGCRVLELTAERPCRGSVLDAPRTDPMNLPFGVERPDIGVTSLPLTDRARIVNQDDHPRSQRIRMISESWESL